MSTATLPPPPAKITSDALFEVVYGVIVEKEMGATSIATAGHIHEVLAPHVRAHRLGRTYEEMLFILDAEADLKRRPDVAFVSATTWPLDKTLPTGDWEIAPDIAVEVVSPNDTVNHLREKIREYFQYGVKEVWVVITVSQEIYIYSDPLSPRVLPTNGVLESPLIPGFRLPLATLFTM